jgi:hypothetical protein
MHVKIREVHFSLRFVSCNITLHGKAPLQHKTMQTAACGSLHSFAKIPTLYTGATCPKPPTCRTPKLCPSSTFIELCCDDVDIGDSTLSSPMHENLGEVLFSLRFVSCNITLHGTAPHQHKTMKTAASGSLHRFRKDTNNLYRRNMP